MPSLNIRKVSQEFMDYVSDRAEAQGMTKRDWVMNAVYAEKDIAALKSEFRTAINYLITGSDATDETIDRWKEIVG